MMNENERTAGMLHFSGVPGAVISLYSGGIQPGIQGMVGREVSYGEHQGVLLHSMDQDDGSLMVNVVRYNSHSQVDVVVGETVKTGDKIFFHKIKKQFEKIYDPGVPSMGIVLSSPVVDVHSDDQMVARVLLDNTAPRYDFELPDDEELDDDELDNEEEEL